jgi:hypothetical protein
MFAFGILLVIPSCFSAGWPMDPGESAALSSPHDYVQQGEALVRDGEEAMVVFKHPYRAAPRLELVELMQAHYHDTPFGKANFRFQQVGPAAFSLTSNHAEQFYGSWAVIKWRAHGLRGADPSTELAQANSNPALAARIRQKQVTTAVTDLGGSVSVDANRPTKPVTGVDLHGTKLTDHTLDTLQAFPEMRLLNLFDTPITDASLEHLRPLTQIQILYLNNTRITDAGLPTLKALTDLRELGLVGTRVTDNGLVHVGTFAKLQKLSLSGSSITDQGLAHLRGLANLRELTLINTSATPGAVQALQKAIPKLQIIR